MVPHVPVNDEQLLKERADQIFQDYMLDTTSQITSPTLQSKDPQLNDCLPEEGKSSPGSEDKAATSTVTVLAHPISSPAVDTTCSEGLTPSPIKFIDNWNRRTLINLGFDEPTHQSADSQLSDSSPDEGKSSPQSERKPATLTCAPHTHPIPEPSPVGAYPKEFTTSSHEDLSTQSHTNLFKSVAMPEDSTKNDAASLESLRCFIVNPNGPFDNLEERIKGSYCDRIALRELEFDDDILRSLLYDGGKSSPGNKDKPATSTDTVSAHPISSPAVDAACSEGFTPFFPTRQIIDPQLSDCLPDEEKSSSGNESQSASPKDAALPQLISEDFSPSSEKVSISIAGFCQLMSQRGPGHKLFGEGSPLAPSEGLRILVSGALDKASQALADFQEEDEKVAVNKKAPMQKILFKMPEDASEQLRQAHEEAADTREVPAQLPYAHEETNDAQKVTAQLPEAHEDTAAIQKVPAQLPQAYEETVDTQKVLVKDNAMDNESDVLINLEIYSDVGSIARIKREDISEKFRTDKLKGVAIPEEVKNEAVSKNSFYVYATVSPDETFLERIETMLDRYKKDVDFDNYECKEERIMLFEFICDNLNLYGIPESPRPLLYIFSLSGIFLPIDSEDISERIHPFLFEMDEDEEDAEKEKPADSENGCLSSADVPNLPEGNVPT